MQGFKFQLGDKVKDVVTGYEGIITSCTSYLNGCLTYGVRTQKLRDDKPIDAVWIDEEQLEEIPGEAIVLPGAPVAVSGGPHESPPSRPHP